MLSGCLILRDMQDGTLLAVRQTRLFGIQQMNLGTAHSHDEVLQWWNDPNSDVIQKALPNLTKVQREFLITGMSETQQRELRAIYDGSAE